MGLFDKKVEKESTEEKSSPTVSQSTEINERPRICCLDIDKEIINQLTSSGFNIYSGTLGKKIKVPNKNRSDNHQLLLNYDFPANIHEYDIMIIDLNNAETINYKAEEHIRTEHTGKTATSLLSSYPETIFDPRPLGSAILNNKLSQIGSRPHIIIAFTSESYDVEYDLIKITDGYPTRQGSEKHNIYTFTKYVPLNEPKYGKEMTVCEGRNDLKVLIESHLIKSTYNQTFHHPISWSSEKREPDSNFIPLVKNSSDDIVSFIHINDNALIFYFPQIEAKGDFLNSFLTNIAPDILPELFPFSSTFDWKQNEEYWLPNHKKLLSEKQEIEKDYEKKLKGKETEISTNIEHYSFLHNILTSTGDELVDSLIKYFKWLGFKTVKKVDEENIGTNVLEEDIQIELDNGLLIIECKGIGGTSTDSDCSQISKIKHRRCKERNCFDVYALYIVNHQRYLPPLNRKNPPFSVNQKQDAINDERGLLTTWQLFNLYEEIENGVFDKEEARNNLLKYGLVEFRPTDLALIDEPKELFKNGEVCIINLVDIELKIGEEIFVEKNGKFQKAIIEGIQLDDKPVSAASSGEVGLKLSIPIKKNSLLWKKPTANT